TVRVFRAQLIGGCAKSPNKRGRIWTQSMTRSLVVLNDDIGPGYDRGYRACPCFWGTAPSSIVQHAATLVAGTTAVDIGCGEGKNAAYLATIGYRVTAV